jgi:hypothetical protein
MALEQITPELIATCVEQYKREAESARHSRMELNSANFDSYHLKRDFSHKRPGQSREFIPRQSIAVEQISTFIQQSLVDSGDWFAVEKEPGVVKPLFTDNEIRLLVSRQLDKTEFPVRVHDGTKLALLGSLMIFKVGSRRIAKTHFTVDRKPKLISQFLGRDQELLLRKDRFIKQLDIQTVRQEDYYPDPTGEGLYEIQRIEMDLWKLQQLAQANPDVYDMEAVEALRNGLIEEDQKARKSTETGQNIPEEAAQRRRIELLEMWGTLVNPHTGELIAENVTTTIANGRFVVARLRENPFWHQQTPFVVTPFTRVPHSVWHKAPMDAPTKLNHTLTELLNLAIDGGMQAAHGIKEIRTDWLEDVSQVSNGLIVGDTLKINTSAPADLNAVRRVDTSVPNLTQTLEVFAAVSSEYQQSAMVNDLRLGTLPNQRVTATEVVESSQSINSLFAGVAKIIEAKGIVPVLDKAWMVMLQDMDDLDDAEIEALLGPERAKELANISAKERFARSVNGHKFKVSGITQMLNRTRDFRKITTLMQTIAGVPPLAEAFSKIYSFENLLEQVMRALDINTDKLKLNEADRALVEAAKLNAAQAGQAESAQGAVPNVGSQLPQAGSAEAEQGTREPAELPRASFPTQTGESA